MLQYKWTWSKQFWSNGDVGMLLFFLPMMASTMQVAHSVRNAWHHVFFKESIFHWSWIYVTGSHWQETDGIVNMRFVVLNVVTASTGERISHGFRLWNHNKIQHFFVVLGFDVLLRGISLFSDKKTDHTVNNYIYNWEIRGKALCPAHVTIRIGKTFVQEKVTVSWKEVNGSS